MDGLEEYLKGIEKAGVTGIIVADPLIIETCKRVAPSVEVHLSTQQSLSNWRHSIGKKKVYIVLY